MAERPSKKPRVIAQGRFIQLIESGGWEYATRANASGVVAVIAVTREQQLILTEQFRPPVGRAVIDLPAGLAGDNVGQFDEQLVEAAKRELVEETGFTAKVWKQVYEAPSSPGMTNEIVTYFQARNAFTVETGGGVDGEQITTHTISLSSIRRWLKARMKLGTYVDPKVYVALALIQ